MNFDIKKGREIASDLESPRDLLSLGELIREAPLFPSGKLENQSIRNGKNERERKNTRQQHPHDLKKMSRGKVFF